MPRTRNLLAGKTCTVSLSRNGLVIEVPEVQAVDAAQVAAALLEAARGLVKAGYDELIPDAGGVHGGPLGEYADDDHAEQARRRVIGFRV
jgi:hypothetical protein